MLGFVGELKVEFEVVFGCILSRLDDQCCQSIELIVDIRISHLLFLFLGLLLFVFLRVKHLLLDDVDFGRFPWYSGNISIECIEVCSDCGLSRTFSPGFESVVGALVGMNHWNLLFISNFGLSSWNEEFDAAWFVANWSVDWVFAAEIEMDYSIDTLSLIPDEKRHFGMFVLIEF